MIRAQGPKVRNARLRLPKVRIGRAHDLDRSGRLRRVLVVLKAHDDYKGEGAGRSRGGRQCDSVVPALEPVLLLCRVRGVAIGRRRVVEVTVWRCQEGLERHRLSEKEEEDGGKTSQIHS